MRRVLVPLILFFPVLAAAQCSSALYSSGTYPGVDGPAQYVVYMPKPLTCFNGQVILFAHGYVPVGSPAGTWQSQLTLPGGATLYSIVNSLGFGFAASGFSKDGLAILQGVQDTKGLIGVLNGLSIYAQKYFLTGASEGGLITAKSIEADATYAGGLAVCGPIGSFRQQIDYLGDARVLFDYFFPGVLGTAWSETNYTIPTELMTDWTSKYVPAIQNAVNSNFLATVQYLNTANIPIGLSYSNAVSAITAVLWYNVFATNDAFNTLTGNPYDNMLKIYSGSFNDAYLNGHVARFSADSGALVQMPKYETDGLLINPLVTLHTTADPVVPYWQEPLYYNKVSSENRLFRS